MTPSALPMLQPMRQAVAFQLQRNPMTSAELSALDVDSRSIGFAIAGLERKSLIEAAYREATAAIAEGLTKEAFLGRLGELLDKQAGTFLTPDRLDLIAQNNLATAYGAGRWAQANDPDVLAERPYFQYPLGPHDDKTTTICLELEAFIARWDDPVWNHIAPPNHHRERHLQLLTLTQDEAEATGLIYESPDGAEYPVINGQTILPDPGWDTRPGLLTADEGWLAARAAELDIPEVLAKTSVDYDLSSLLEAPIGELPELPALGKEIVDIGSAEDLSSAWDRFSAELDIPEGDDSVVINDVFGDGVRVGRGTFDGMTSTEDLSFLAPLIEPTIEDPFEVWMVERRDAAGTSLFNKRYIGVYKNGETAFVIALEETPEGVLRRVPGSAWGPTAWNAIEKLRAGRLLMTKSTKKVIN